MNLLVASMLVSLASTPQTTETGPAATVPAKTLPAQTRSAGELGRLLQRFAAVKTLTAAFVEQKSMALLAAPIETHGVLVFHRGKRGPELARHIRRPHASSAVIRRGKLRFGDARGRESIDLSSNPAVRNFVDSFVLVLAGDEAGLSRLYALQYSRGPEASGEQSWTLRMKPKDPTLARVIAELEIKGRGVRIETMTMREVGGDESITRFSATQLDRPLSAGQRRELFSLSPSAASLEAIVGEAIVGKAKRP